MMLGQIVLNPWDLIEVTLEKYLRRPHHYARIARVTLTLLQRTAMRSG